MLLSETIVPEMAMTWALALNEHEETERLDHVVRVDKRGMLITEHEPPNPSGWVVTGRSTMQPKPP